MWCQSHVYIISNFQGAAFCTISLFLKELHKHVRDNHMLNRFVCVELWIGRIKIDCIVNLEEIFTSLYNKISNETEKNVYFKC